MAIVCDAILKLAADNIEAADCEVKFRSVIGRAYYASFHKATEFHCGLKDQGMLPAEKVGKHRQLSYALENPTVSDPAVRRRSIQVGYLCRDLHTKRVDADYNIGMDIKKRVAEQAVEQAKDIFRLTS